MKKPDIEKIKETIKKHRLPIIVSAIIVTLLLIIIPPLVKSHANIRASGTIEVREIDLASRVSSRVIKIDAPEGSSVAKDGLVITLDDRLVKAQRASAEALLFSAEDSYRRSTSLFNSGSIPRQQFEQARSMYNKAQADFEQAQLLAEETTISAPWDGVVLRTHVEEGELVSAFTPLATFGDMKNVKIKIYVGVRDLGRVKQGQDAVIKVDSFPNRKIPGKVSTISEKAEFTPKTIQTRDERIKQVFSVEIIAANLDGILKPGMPADVELLPAGKTEKK